MRDDALTKIRGHRRLSAALLAGALLVPFTPRMVAAQPPPGSGPWNNDLVIAESADGRRFGEARRFVDRGGVPSLIRDGKGRLIAAFQWFPLDRREAFDRIAVAVSEDGGKTWSAPRPIMVSGLPPDFVRPFDPTLALLDDGRVRLYFTDHPRNEHIPAIYSAVSSDGERYQYEPGARFGVEGERVIDCAIGRIGKTWHLYAPVQNQTGRAYHAVSEDGLKFTRRPNIELPGSGNWLGCAVTTDDGLRFYGTGPGGWSATSRDGASWKLDTDTRMPGADPGVAPTRDGRYLLIATGPRRADASAARPPGFGPPGFGPPDALPFPPPGPRRDEPIMTATSDYLYILRNGVLYQYNARDLTLLRRVRLPDDREPLRDREP